MSDKIDWTALPSSQITWSSNVNAPTSTTVMGYRGGGMVFFKRGVQLTQPVTGSHVNTYLHIGKLPADFTPAVGRNLPIVCNNYNEMSFLGILRITTNGDMYIGKTTDGHDIVAGEFIQLGGVSYSVL